MQHRRFTPLPIRPSALWPAIAAGLLLSACTSSGDSLTLNPVRSLAETTGFATTPPPAADFVQGSRQTDATYMAVGVTPPARPIAPKTPEQIKAMENELDSTLNSHSAIAGKPRPKEVYRSAGTRPDTPPPNPFADGRFVAPTRDKPQDSPKPAARPAVKPATGTQPNPG